MAGAASTSSGRTVQQETNQLPIQKAATSNPPTVRFSDLPRDILYTIVSKLPPKEFGRTSILSKEWRCMWQVCPRLTFDSTEICKCDVGDIACKHTWRFVHGVNRVLINSWVSFAISSRTKNLALDLKPTGWWEHNDRYMFPFHLLNRPSGGTLCLQNLQLSFVSLRPPLHFKGFPNLRKLHLQVTHVSSKDLQHVLSHCCNVEWLHLDRWFIHDELIVATPLPRLRYLSASYCKLTKMEFSVVNLLTFEYASAKIEFNLNVFQHVIVLSLNGIPAGQNLTLKLTYGLTFPKKQWLWDNPLKFCNRRHLQLLVVIIDVDEILCSSTSFLRATPSIEKLEVHSRGQLEFLLHFVENAHGLEVVGVYYLGFINKVFRPPFGFEEAKQTIRNRLSAVASQNVKLDVI
ncbi:hypothetical protein BS78_01G195100 [Paspalum vaginatum]|nr:hypothetical protein BS78_01G195100 [Paspalum vaginatum]